MVCLLFLTSQRSAIFDSKYRDYDNVVLISPTNFNYSQGLYTNNFHIHLFKQITPDNMYKLLLKISSIESSVGPSKSSTSSFFDISSYDKKKRRYEQLKNCNFIKM